RLVVLLEPVSFRENNIVTVSPGSTALLGGVQFSWTSTVASATTTALPFTTTVKLLVALRCCCAGGAEELKSVTTVVKTFVVWFWAAVGVQVMTPLALMLAPAGPVRE